MGLIVLPATPSDASSSITIENAAYAGGPLSGILYTGPFPLDDSPNSRASLLAKEIRADKSMRFVKVVAVDNDGNGDGGDGEDVAFAKWFVKRADWHEEEEARQQKKKGYGEGANEEACEILFGQMRAAYLERWKGKPHVYLKLLHTSPAHQRRGAGSLLLKALSDETDSLGLPAYLEATAMGKGLYENFGFKEVGRVTGDFSKWGGPTEHVNYLMLREAVKKD